MNKMVVIDERLKDILEMKNISEFGENGTIYLKKCLQCYKISYNGCYKFEDIYDIEDPNDSMILVPKNKDSKNSTFYALVDNKHVLRIAKRPNNLMHKGSYYYNNGIKEWEIDIIRNFMPELDDRIRWYRFEFFKHILDILDFQN